MSHRTRILSYTLLIGLCSLATIHAANVRWSGQGGNSLFHNTGNWTGGLIPGVIDVAQFGRSVQFLPQTYTVSFNNNATNQAIHIEDDNVTFDLNSRVYTVTAADGVLVGLPGNFAGRLTVTDGTLASSTKIDVGAATNRVGFLTVGLNGLISGAANLNVGKLATGTLTVQAGGDISTTGTTTIGMGTGITGTANIVGDGTIGSASLLTGPLNIGNMGNGTVNVQLGGLLQNSGAASIGSGDLFSGVGTGTVHVMNQGSVWNSQGLLKVGDAGNGEVNITLGGKLTSIDATVGADVSNSGEVNVDGTSSLWENSGTLTVGGLGNGTLNITDNGYAESSDVVIGSANLPTSNGTVNVNGAGSILEISNELRVGDQGAGTVNITGGGAILAGLGLFSYVGINDTGNVNVSGVGSVWETTQFVVIGSGSEGTLTLSNGGTALTLSDGIVGALGGSGNVTVTGASSLWRIFGDLYLGSSADSSDGTLDISNGGRVKSVEGQIGRSVAGIGHVTVDGLGSVWEYTGNQSLGEIDGDLILGNGTLEISAGGQLISTAMSGVVVNEIGSLAGNSGVVRVTGSGSLWDTDDADTGSISVGRAGNGTLEITAGGVVRADQITIGDEVGSDGTVKVISNNALLDCTDDLIVGKFGTGKLEITDGGRIITGGTAYVAERTGASGNVMITGAGSSWDIDSTLRIGFASPSSGETGLGTVRVQSGARLFSSDRILVSVGSLLSLEGGTLITPEIDFSGDANANSEFDWTTGTLQVAFFRGDLINPFGIFAPINAFGNAIVEGDYNQLSDATLQIEIGGAMDHDSVQILGNAFLAGNLEIVLQNGFTPGLSDTFTVFNVVQNLLGSFANVANGQRLTTSDGLGSFLVNYGAGSTFNPKQIVLSNFLAGNGLPGDFDVDGDVDGRDFLVWQRNPGVGNLADWQANYGVPFSATSIAVPEPGTLFLLSSVVVVFSIRRPFTNWKYV